MIAIIDYRAGNLTSVERAVRHLGIECMITAERDAVLSASHIIFPGVGAAGKAMEVIRSSHLDQILPEAVARKKPFLGICLGAQIILERSEENDALCLGIIPGGAKKFPEGNLKIPHMGWNTILPVRSHPILQGIDPSAHFYFVHSYYPDPAHANHTIAVTEYGLSFSSVIGCRNVVATQFHPEKSGKWGLQLLKNFYEWDGCE